MKKRIHSEAGFTLVELLVATLIGTLVMGAAVTVMLLGMRINNQATQTAQNQFTTRIVMDLLEDLASEGSISGVNIAEDGWKILGEDQTDQNGNPVKKVVLMFDSAEQTIYTGEKSAAVLKGVYASHVSFDSSGLLTFSIETAEGNYNSSVYCRTMSYVANSNMTTAETIIKDIKDSTVTDPKTKFLQALVSQYPTDGTVNKGVIVGTANEGKHYAQWYVGDGQWNNNGWNKDTPWCACFISWALVQSGIVAPAGHPKWFSYVDDSDASFETYFGTLKTTDPAQGDLIFFDWITDDGKSDAQHIGAVLKVDGDYVYTIEGNSAGIVAVRKYPLNDDRILGYGVLTWEETA